MRMTILGSGTSTGVPVPGCSCDVCRSPHPRNKRLRTSALVQSDQGSTLLIDASTDLRQQALTFGVSRIDSVIFTHSHADHILGVDDLRGFNFFQGGSIPCYGTAETLADIRHMFYYAFNPNPLYLGGGVPKLELKEIDGSSPFVASGISVQPIHLLHGKLPVVGFRIGDLAYLTDTNHIPPESFRLLQGIRVLILDGLREQEHPSHFSISEATEVAKQLGPEQTWLIHMTHSVDYEVASATLPPGIALAYDGLTIEFT